MVGCLRMVVGGRCTLLQLQLICWCRARHQVMQGGGARKRVLPAQSLPDDLEAGRHAPTPPLAVPVNLEVPARVRRSTSPFNLVRRSRTRVNTEQIPEEFMLSTSPLSILPSDGHRPHRPFSAKSKFSQLKQRSKESASSLKGNIKPQYC